MKKKTDGHGESKELMVRVGDHLVRASDLLASNSTIDANYRNDLKHLGSIKDKRG